MEIGLKSGQWIDGCEVPAENNLEFPVMDPGKGEVFGAAARGNQADIDRAVESAQKAFRGKEWGSMPAARRSRLLWEWARVVEHERDRLARLLSLENGKPLRHAQDEVDTVIRNFEYYAGWADKTHGRVIPLQPDVLDYIRHEPLGVVGHIIPWNYPIDIFARGVAPCLAVGNTIVAKPAEETPFSTIELARLAATAGFPPGVVNVVTGFGEEAGTSLAGHPGIQGLAFCGSVQAGKQVLQSAARWITPVVSMELGGKSPCLVFEDADIDKAANSVAWGICYNTGQSCGALSRLLVPKALYEQVVEKIAQIMATIHPGYGLDNPDMGSLISAEQLERVEGYIRQGQAEGAQLLYGGKRAQPDGLENGYYIEPALFGESHPGMRTVEEEIFGPVVSVLTFEDEAEAVSLANNSRYGLSAEIWTRDLSRAHRVAAQLDVSHVTINGGGGFGIEAPFGGVKQSGFGREGGYESILQYSRVKNVWINL